MWVAVAIRAPCKWLAVPILLVVKSVSPAHTLIPQEGSDFEEDCHNVRHDGDIAGGERSRAGYSNREDDQRIYPDMVEGGGGLPGVSALLQGLERRRHWRLARDHFEARLPAGAGRERDLAESALRLAQRR